jgi:hypothetical protein
VSNRSYLPDAVGLNATTGCSQGASLTSQAVVHSSLSNSLSNSNSISASRGPNRSAASIA